MAAVRAAVRQGADLVENDVQRTRDGVLVVVHDTTLSRTTNVAQVFPDRAPWRVVDFTLAELERLDAGSWFAPGYAGERVPTLAEWARAVGPRQRMLLEAKTPGIYPGIEADLENALRHDPALRAAVRQGRVVVQSFDHAWLRLFAQRMPEVPLGLVFDARPSTAEIGAAAQWAEQVNPALSVIDAGVVETIHDAGLKAHVWTVNDSAGMRRAIGWGVDGIITDHPQVLRELVERRHAAVA